MLVHRPATTDAEIERAARVLGGDDASPPGAKWFLALAQRPVERIVGAAVWWPSDDGSTARFRWSLIHAHASGAPAVDFLRALAVHAVAHAVVALRTSAMLPPDSGAAHVLELAGFAKAQQNLLFLVPGQECRARAHRVGERIWKSKAQELTHAKISLPPLTHENAESVWAFIQPHGLMQRHEFVSAMTAGMLRDFSVVLEVAGRVCGAYLCQRQSDEVVNVPVFVVATDAAVPQDVCSALLVHAWAKRPGCESLRAVHLRADPLRNPSTPRLALRYGGRQTGELWSYERRMTNEQ